MNIYEVMEYGQIVYSNEEFGVLITANGSYLNWWNQNPTDGVFEFNYINADCRSTSQKPYHEMTMQELEKSAEEWFNEETEEKEECPYCGFKGTSNELNECCDEAQAGGFGND